jgi:ABC-type transport system involved in multi-copper enzyme maturation permease subunit
MNLGPILRLELTRAARRPSHYLWRMACGLVLLFVAWSVYSFWAEYQSRADGLGWRDDHRLLPWFAELAVLDLACVGGLAIVALVPGMVAGSIAEEDRRRTTLDLLGSPLSSLDIVLGKLTARLVPVGGALLIGVPMIAPFLLMGALNPEIIGRAFALWVALTAFVATLSMLVSVLVRRPREAILTSYALVLGWLLIPPRIVPITRSLPWPFGWMRTLNDAVLLGHPHETVGYLWHFVMLMTINHPAGLAWARAGLNGTFARVVTIQLAASLVFLALAVAFLRPIRLGLRKRASGRAVRATPRPALGDDPMLWKERYAPGRRPRPWRRLGLGLLGLLLLVPLIEPALGAFAEWRQSWRHELQIHRRWSLNESLRQLNAGLYLYSLMAVAAVAASSVTGERERGTWTSLTTTLVTGREVAHAKVIGSARVIWGLAVPFGVLWAIGLATGSVHPLGVVASAIGLVVFVRYAAALGVFCSMTAGTSSRALAATLLALLASNALPLLFLPIELIGRLSASREALWLAGVSPFVEWIALISPLEIRGFSGAWMPDAQIWLPFGLWNTRLILGAGLVRTYLVSLALHALAAIAFTRASAWAFDRGRGASRRAHTRRPD